MTNVERFITVVRRSAEPHEERLCDALELALKRLNNDPLAHQQTLKEIEEILK